MMLLLFRPATVPPAELSVSGWLGLNVFLPTGSANNARRHVRPKLVASASGLILFFT
jgi:hypothetical protein